MKASLWVESTAHSSRTAIHKVGGMNPGSCPGPEIWHSWKQQDKPLTFWELKDWVQWYRISLASVLQSPSGKSILPAVWSSFSSAISPFLPVLLEAAACDILFSGCYWVCSMHWACSVLASEAAALIMPWFSGRMRLLMAVILGRMLFQLSLGDPSKGENSEVVRGLLYE